MPVTLDNAGLPQSGEDGEVSVSFTGDVAIIQMKCGENRINASFINKMNAALDEVESNHRCKAVITTGSGKFYCNGLDLQWLIGLRAVDTTFGKQAFSRYVALVLRLLTFPMPTVAAINGHAYNAGAHMTLAHDYRVMKSERGFWCINEVHLKLRPRVIASVIGGSPEIGIQPQIARLLRRKIPDPAAFAEILFNGKKLTAQRAKQLNVTSASFPGERLIEGAVNVAAEAAGADGLDRDTLRTLKRDAYRDVIKAPKFATFDELEAAKL